MDSVVNKAAAATYVQIGREELEEWLDSVGFRGKWDRDPKFSGVYLLKLSHSVAVKLSSTIGSRDDAMGVGKASMQLSLVSLVTGRTVNKKAQGQSHFKRTTGWKKTWVAGIETMKKAYLSAADFYDVIATISDRDAYQKDLLEEISSVPGWDTDHELIGLYRKVERGGVLMPRESEAISKAKSRKPKGPDPQRVEPTPAKLDEPDHDEEPGLVPRNQEDLKHERMEALRKLWAHAKRANDQWTMDFAENIAKKFVSVNRRLSGPQLRVVADKMEKYRIPDLQKNPARDLF